MQMEMHTLRQVPFSICGNISANVLVVVVELYEAQVHGQISLEQTYYYQVN